jgi:hypothetical protein
MMVAGAYALKLRQRRARFRQRSGVLVARERTG